MASFSAVDAVLMFADDTPLRLIEAIRRDVLIKGADYTESEVVGADFVRRSGGRLILAALAPEISTTKTIDRMKR